MWQSQGFEMRERGGKHQIKPVWFKPTELPPSPGCFLCLGRENPTWISWVNSKREQSKSLQHTKHQNGDFLMHKWCLEKSLECAGGGARLQFQPEYSCPWCQLSSVSTQQEQLSGGVKIQGQRGNSTTKRKSPTATMSKCCCSHPKFTPSALPHRELWSAVMGSWAGSLPSAEIIFLSS